MSHIYSILRPLERYYRKKNRKIQWLECCQSRKRIQRNACYIVILKVSVESIKSWGTNSNPLKSMWTDFLPR